MYTNALAHARIHSYALACALASECIHPAGIMHAHDSGMRKRIPETRNPQRQYISSDGQQHGLLHVLAHGLAHAWELTERERTLPPGSREETTCSTFAERGSIICTAYSSQR